MSTRSRRPTALVLAAIALAGASFALPASCGAPPAVPPTELVGAIAESAASLRDTFEEHKAWYSRVELDPTIQRQERDEAQQIRAEISELLDSLYALDACQKEGWSRETVFISDLIGQLEEAIDVHVQSVSGAQTQLELRVEEGIYAGKVGDLLDELDSHIEAAKVEAEQRPSLRCGKVPVPTMRRKRTPLT